jgi:hypothetical protein
MIVGLVNSGTLVTNMTAKYHVDRCEHCGGQKNNPKHHDQHGRCHRRVMIWRRNGRHWKTAGRTE